jgi:hypothetical protein
MVIKESTISLYIIVVIPDTRTGGSASLKPKPDSVYDSEVVPFISHSQTHLIEMGIFYLPSSFIFF